MSRGRTHTSLRRLRRSPRGTVVVSTGLILLAAVLWARVDRGSGPSGPDRPIDLRTTAPVPAVARPGRESARTRRESMSAGVSLVGESLDLGPNRGARPRVGSERAYFEAFLGQARSDVEAFRLAVDAVLRADRPLAEQVAALRAWHRAGVEPPYDPVARSLGDPSAATKLREFALRFLDAHSQRDSRARDVLIDFLSTRPVRARFRAQAMFSVLRWGTDGEIDRCLGLIYSVQDAGVVERAMAALEDSDARSARWILEFLRQAHPTVSATRAIEGHSDR